MKNIMGRKLKTFYLNLFAAGFLIANCGDSGVLFFSEENGKTILAQETTSAENTSLSPVLTDTELPAVPLQGSYINYIKINGPETSFDESPENIVRVWQKSGQNLIVYPAYDGNDNNPIASCDTNGDGANSSDDKSTSSDGTEQQYFCTFLQILEATKNTDIKVMALFPQPHQRSHIRHLDDEAYTEADANGDEREKKNLWNEALAHNFEFLSTELAPLYPNLIGVVRDDSGLYICGADDNPDDAAENCNTLDDLTRLKEAAHKGVILQSLETAYLEYGMNTILPDTYTLGGTYGQWHYAGDDARIRILYNPPSGQSIDSAHLALMLVDYNDRSAEEWSGMSAEKRISVNGKILWSQPFEGDDYVTPLDLDILKGIGPKNEMVIEVQHITDVSTIHTTLMTIYNPTLTINGEEVSCSVVEIDFNKTGPTPQNPGSCVLYLERNGKDEQYLLATSNDPWRPTEKHIDGFLEVFNPHSSFYSGFETLYQDTMDAVGNSLFVYPVWYANLWTEDFSIDQIDPLVLGNQVGDAKQAGVDGILMWNAPNALALPQEGIFSERTIENYSMRAYWPSYQTGFQKYYQEYTTKKKWSGEVTVCLKDNVTTTYDGDTAETPRYFSKTISSHTAPSGKEIVYYSDGIGGDESGVSLLDFPCVVGEEGITFIVPSQHPAYLKWGLYETENIGSMNITVDANVFVNGEPLQREAWDFKSWVGEPRLIEIWKAIKDAYAP